jgi:hypothetical protein
MKQVVLNHVKMLPLLCTREENTHLDCLSCNGLISHQLVESLIDSTEMDKVMAIQPGSDLVEHIIWDGVQVLAHVGHVQTERKR